MSKDLRYQKSSRSRGIFPSFIHELFSHIWLGSNQMQLRFLESQKNCISACCCGWMKGTIYVFSLSCVSFDVFSAQKILDNAKCDTNSDSEYCLELKHSLTRKKKGPLHFWLWLVLHALMLILNLAFHLLNLFDFPNKYLLKTFVPIRFTSFYI